MKRLSREQNTVLSCLAAYFCGKAVAVCDEKARLSEVFEISERHQVMPMVYSALKDTEFFKSSPEKELFEKKVPLYIAMQMRKDLRFWSIYEKLLAGGICPILLKGVSLREIYPDPYFRYSSDEDIWVEIQNFEACDKILREDGFEREKITDGEDIASRHDVAYICRNSGLIIELHLNPIGTDVPMRKTLNDSIMPLFSESREYSFGGHKYLSLDAAANAIFVFSHYVKHLLARAASIRMCSDVLLYIKKHYEEIDFEKFFAFLDELGYRKIFFATVAIGRNALGIELPIYEEIDYEELLQDICDGGAMAELSEVREKSGMVTERVLKGQRGAVFKAVFPPLCEMKKQYSILRKIPILLPFMYIDRIVKKLCENKQKNFIKGVREGKKRIKMLKKYDIL